MNCKLGDLAFLVRASVPENIGAVMQITGPDLDPRQSAEHGFRWICYSRSPHRGANQFTGELTAPNTGPFSVPDAWLRPISGVPLEDEVTDDMKEPA